MSRWLRSTEYDLDDFDWLHGRVPGPPVPFDRDFFVTGAVIFGWFPALVGVCELVRWLIR